MDNELVSVIMPAYNAEKYISKAIKSVMNQTYHNWELIVIDDGSADSTVDVVSKIAAVEHRVHLYKNQSNMGVSKTRNKGFDLAKGKYIALLDSDDFWHSDKLEKQLALLKEKNADVVYSSYSLINEQSPDKAKAYIVAQQTSYSDMLCENIIGCSTVLMRSEITKMYCFDSAFFHEDYVLWLTLLKDGYSFAGCKEVLVDYTVVQNSRSHNKIKAAKNRWIIYRKSQKLSIPKSAAAFFSYMLNGIKKYME